MSNLSRYRLALMLSAVGLTLIGPAHADPSSDAAIQSLQQQINDLNAQLQTLKQKEQQQEQQQQTAPPSDAAAPPPASSVSSGTGEIAIQLPPNRRRVRWARRSPTAS